MSTRVLYEERQAHGVRIGEMRLDSVNGMNPLSSATVREMHARFAALHADDAPHAVVLSAQGRFFCAGADVKEFRAFDAPAFREYMSGILALYAAMIEAARPVVCVVHADALGGGAALALCADFAIAAQGARFGFPESHRGLAGGGYLIPRLVGKHLAAEMVILGRSYGAGEMLAHGLLNRVCAPEALAACADELCAALAAIPASALRVAKRSLAGGLTVDLREAMQRHVDAQTAAFVVARAEGRV